MRTQATELVGCRYPLFGFNRSPAVVAAISKAGGFGVLPAHHYSPEELDGVLTWIDDQVDGAPYGIDLVVPPIQSHTTDLSTLVTQMRAQIPAEHVHFTEQLMSRFAVPEPQHETSMHGRLAADEAAAGIDPAWIQPLLDVAFSHPIALVANALGTPPDELKRRCRAHGVPLAALVGSAKHAVKQMHAGVDLLVAQGYEAGGHTGEIATMVLTPEVVAVAGPTPVLAAGGIATGRQMAAAIALGAAGAWCGSVWLSSVEDITIDVIKTKYLAASSVDTVRSRSRTGKPARQLRSAWHDAWDAEDAPPPLGLPLQYMLTNALWERIDAAAVAGNPGAIELESFFIGQVVGSFERLRPTAEIVDSMVTECHAAMRALGALAM